jgi:D-tagatose-1,6-bisphosphate aldolase subunit GatZ/KbaZ
VNALRDLIERHRAGSAVGIYSVCSAHPLVLRAALELARERGGLALIEATSNQVNQDGGYTGLRPAGFRDLVLGMADEIDLPRVQVILGGDHLGPNCWQAQPSQAAMARAGIMIGEYVSAGFQKIHLDCSMACADDPRALSDELVAERTATLCVVSETAARARGGAPPTYIIGTEVPVPGGAQEALHELAVTSPQAALATIAAHRRAFERHGLSAAWDRVIGLVVQPGVEFDNDRVIDYVPSKAAHLSRCIAAEPHLVFEAHSTDYQNEAALASLVRDHFAILKVGPAATFALREALWALDEIEQELLGVDRSSRVRETVLEAMQADPSHWRKYYDGTGTVRELQMQYSLSDRIRYYWPVPAVAAAVNRLCASIDAHPPPPALLSQYLPSAYAALRDGNLELHAREIVTCHIRALLAQYARACGQSGTH